MTQTDKHKYFVRSGDALISHCRCKVGMAGNPVLSQQECPWCGCGWLWTCASCGKAFAFAKVELVEPSLEAIARTNFKAMGVVASRRNVVDWVDLMQSLLKPYDVGVEVAYLDGFVMPVDETDIEFEGIHRTHRFDVVPQVAALKDRSVLDRTLSSTEYWGFEPEERADDDNY